MIITIIKLQADPSGEQPTTDSEGGDKDEDEHVDNSDEDPDYGRKSTKKTKVGKKKNPKVGILYHNSARWIYLSVPKNFKLWR